MYNTKYNNEYNNKYKNNVMDIKHVYDRFSARFGQCSAPGHLTSYSSEVFG